MRKTKRKVAAFLLAVGMSLTSIPMSAYAQEVQEPSNQEQESQEVVQEEQAESVEEQETVEFQGENPESNQTITSMDLDGNVTEVVIEDGTVDSYAADKARIGGGQIVNFNTGICRRGVKHFRIYTWIVWSGCRLPWDKRRESKIYAVWGYWPCRCQ